MLSSRSRNKEIVDWIEVGTGVIKEYGMSIIREMKNAYPQKMIVADMKTCDAGKHEAVQAFESGADITTVMAFSADQTITDTLEVAAKYRKRIMVDLLGITNRTRIEELVKLGVDLTSLHFGKDMQKAGAFDTDLFDLVNKFNGMEVAVAGGVNLQSLPAILHYRPNIVIVGSAITKTENRLEMASKLKGAMKEYENNYSNR
jgi:3-hexulose-6-phosphate synthase